MAKGIAAVTGGSGMIGRKIAQQLLHLGYDVRILTRKKSFCMEGAQIHVGDVADEKILRSFFDNVSYVFHCAAELNDQSKMQAVNVAATQNILDNIRQSKGIVYFCYLSSAGVIGLADQTLVDETTRCNPQNHYEKSKRAAEELVSRGINDCTVVMLRPTDVIDDQRPGALALPMRNSWRDKLLVLLKGNECAHIVHAEDVADAALHFINARLERPACFFVSCDHERLNTFGGLWSLYKAIQQGRSVEGIEPIISLPMIIPYLLRRLRRGPGNYGNVRYSSDKLLSTGFRYRLGVEGAVRRMAASQTVNQGRP